MPDDKNDHQLLFKEMDKSLVYKSNQLIEAQYCLSAASQKLAATLISRINPNENNLPVFNLSVAEYAELMGISQQSAYKLIKKTNPELKRVVITLRKEGSRSFTNIGMFRECHYDDDEKRVMFEFESRIEPHLRAFAGNFTKYQVGQIQQLKSKYSIRMYEYLRKLRPLNTPNHQNLTRIISLQDLRSILNASNKTYDRFADFRKAILQTVQRELSEKTDIRFDFAPIRKGRKIGAIKLEISHNQQFQQVGDEVLSGDLAAPMDISHIDPGVVANIRFQLPEMTDEQLGLIASTYSQELILEALFDLMRAMTTGSVAGTPLNYYLGILKNKRREDQAAKPAAAKTTAEKLTDRSWADGLVMDEEGGR